MKEKTRCVGLKAGVSRDDDDDDLVPSTGRDTMLALRARAVSFRASSRGCLGLVLVTAGGESEVDKNEGNKRPMKDWRLLFGVVGASMRTSATPSVSNFVRATMELRLLAGGGGGTTLAGSAAEDDIVPSKPRNVLGALVSLRMISKRRPGAGLQEAVEGGSFLVFSAACLRNM